MHVQVALALEGEVRAEGRMGRLIRHERVLTGQRYPAQVVEAAQLEAVEPLALELVGGGDLREQGLEASEPCGVS